MAVPGGLSSIVAAAKGAPSAEGSGIGCGESQGQRGQKTEAGAGRIASGARGKGLRLAYMDTASLSTAFHFGRIHRSRRIGKALAKGRGAGGRISRGRETNQSSNRTATGKALFMPGGGRRAEGVE